VIGELRHRVTIKTPIATLDEGGGQTIDWQDLATVWTRIVTLGGAEIVRASDLVPRLGYRLTIRYRTDVTAAMRVAFGEKLLEIDAVYDPVGDGVALFLDCHDASAP
jgi:SPP1 family predicted phage head-tail adaptor